MGIELASFTRILLTILILKNSLLFGSDAIATTVPPKIPKYYNTTDVTGIKDFTGPITVVATASTDIWRQPPDTDIFSAPVVYKSIPISSFKSSRVSVSADWKTLFDQGGLVIVLPPKRNGSQKRWIKTGVEFFDPGLTLATVATDDWADGSLLPSKGKLTVEIAREPNADGTPSTVLSVSRVEDNGTKTLVREVTWAFYDLDESLHLWVGVYAAKPIESKFKELAVTFKDFTIQYQS